MIEIVEIGIPKHGKSHAEDITLPIKRMRLEPKKPLKRIFLFNFQEKNLQKGAHAPFSFNVNIYFHYSIFIYS